MYDKFSYIYDELMKGQVDYDLLASNVIQICDKYKIAVKNILECGMGSGNLTEKFLKEKLMLTVLIFQIICCQLLITNCLTIIMLIL